MVRFSAPLFVLFLFLSYFISSWRILYAVFWSYLPSLPHLFPDSLLPFPSYLSFILFSIKFNLCGSNRKGLHFKRKLAPSSPTANSLQQLPGQCITSHLTFFSVLAFDLAWSCTGFLHSVTTAVSSYVQGPCCDQKSLFPGITHHFLLLQYFYPLLSSDT